MVFKIQNSSANLDEMFAATGEININNYYIATLVAESFTLLVYLLPAMYVKTPSMLSLNRMLDPQQGL